MENYGPTQVKCRLLISSISYVMNFRHFLKMLEFNLWHFWKMSEIHYIKNASRHLTWDGPILYIVHWCEFCKLLQNEAIHLLTYLFCQKTYNVFTIMIKWGSKNYFVASYVLWCTFGVLWGLNHLHLTFRPESVLALKKKNLKVKIHFQFFI